MVIRISQSGELFIRYVTLRAFRYIICTAREPEAPPSKAFRSTHFERLSRYLLLPLLGVERVSLTRNLLIEDMAMKLSSACSIFENWASVNPDYTCAREDLTVPFALAESGVPSPFVLFSGSLVRSVECLVSVFDKPSCLPDWVFWEPAGLEVAA